MKIVYDYQIFSSQAYGGPSRYFIELIQELIKLRTFPLVVSPLSSNIYLRNLEKKNKKSFYIKNKYFLGRVIGLYNRLMSEFYFKTINYDLYHATYYNNLKKQKNQKF